MNIKNKIEENLTLSIASIVLASAIPSFGAGLWFSETVRVENKNNEIQLLKVEINGLNDEISEKKLEMISINREINPIKNELASTTLENKNLGSKIALCNDRVEQWSKALDEWKNAYEKTNSALNNCMVNTNVFYKIKELEQEKSNAEFRLSSVINNPLKQYATPLYQRQVLEFQTRILELEKKIIPQ